MRANLEAGAIQAHAAGRLFPWLVECVTGETTCDPEALYTAVAELHNTGRIGAICVLLAASLGAGPSALLPRLVGHNNDPNHGTAAKHPPARSARLA